MNKLFIINLTPNFGEAEFKQLAAMLPTALQMEVSPHT